MVKTENVMNWNRDLGRTGIYLKGALLLGILGISSALILITDNGLHEALLIAVVTWSAARFYYFLFYVIQAYVDPQFKYSGLFSMIKQLRKRGETSRDSQAK